MTNHSSFLGAMRLDTKRCTRVTCASRWMCNLQQSTVKAARMGRAPIPHSALRNQQGKSTLCEGMGGLGILTDRDIFKPHMVNSKSKRTLEKQVLARARPVCKTRRVCSPAAESTRHCVERHSGRSPARESLLAGSCQYAISSISNVSFSETNSCKNMLKT